VTDPDPSNGARRNGALTDAQLADLELADAELTDIELADLEAADAEASETEATDAEVADAEATDAEVAETEATDAELDDGELAEDAVLDSALEALLLVVDEPVDEAQLAAAVAQPTERVAAALRRLAQHYRDQERGIDLRQVGAGWRFYTRDRYAPYVERMLRDGQRAKLTRAALETLAVVAYRQPVTRARVSAVRGVNCDGVLRTLVTRGLVEEFGIDPQTQGILYRTSELFLERLGLSSLAELPPLAPLLPEVDAIDDV
jgi:segregation and condensation protein B